MESKNVSNRSIDWKSSTYTSNSAISHFKFILQRKLKKKHTPFLPGIAHSQFIRLSVPSGFLVGLATNPYILETNIL